MVEGRRVGREAGMQVRESVCVSELSVLTHSPTHARLCVLYGTGVQLFGMAASSIVFAMFGMLSPASRGSLLTAAILLFVFFG